MSLPDASKFWTTCIPVFPKPQTMMWRFLPRANATLKSCRAALIPTPTLEISAPRNKTAFPACCAKLSSQLALSLENPRLEGEQERYVSALHALGEQDNDIVGYAFAINGRLNSADIYPSNGLFRKMWPKLLRASATEAIAARDAANEPAPPKATITEFFGAANSTRGIETSAAKPSRVEIRESSKALVLEARPAAAPASAWVHRNYLAK